MAENENQWTGSPLAQELELTEAEKQLLAASYTGESAFRPIAILTAFYVTKNLRNSTADLIASNQTLAAASDTHAKALVRATWWLAAATIVLAFATIALVLVEIYAIFWGPH
jgi:hypothetical protein